MLGLLPPAETDTLTQGGRKLMTPHLRVGKDQTVNASSIPATSPPLLHYRPTLVATAQRQGRLLNVTSDIVSLHHQRGAKCLAH